MPSPLVTNGYNFGQENFWLTHELRRSRNYMIRIIIIIIKLSNNIFLSSNDTIVGISIRLSIRRIRIFSGNSYKLGNINKASE